MTSVQFEWGDNFRVKPNELVYLLIEGTKIEDSYLTLMRNCILGGDNFQLYQIKESLCDLKKRPLQNYFFESSMQNWENEL